MITDKVQLGTAGVIKELKQLLALMRTPTHLKTECTNALLS
jgi:hypothetical protein